VRPLILGALVDAVSAGLRNLPNLRLDQLPQTADFALWVNACEGGLGMRPGEAPTTHAANRTEARNLALESSPLYEPVVKLARQGFTGTVAELLARLNGMMSEACAVQYAGPRHPTRWGTTLRRMRATSVPPESRSSSAAPITAAGV
jgi:putative DNA primase/helicase